MDETGHAVEAYVSRMQKAIQQYMALPIYLLQDR
jgi:alcohol dehydrogenase class IV